MESEEEELEDELLEDDDDDEEPESSSESSLPLLLLEDDDDELERDFCFFTFFTAGSSEAFFSLGGGFDKFLFSIWLLESLMAIFLLLLHSKL